ncbi:hypothetical protein ACFV7Q_23310 [Streptomyces sp. NPDC059851]|uniref:hypothetical protein n=1 Tax=Streptomyces sp. NPDC059851 TaxID=3346971 RepID=UPI00364DE57B
MTTPPRNPHDHGPTPPPASARRPGVATAAGALALLIGGITTCYAVTMGIETIESGFGPMICFVLMLFGLSIARNAFRLLAADPDGAERLTVQLGIMAGLSGVAIGSMIAQADFSTDGAQEQIIGFIAGFALSALALVLCSHRATKDYVEGRHPNTRSTPPRIG